MHFDPITYGANNDPQRFWAKHLINKIPSSDKRLAILDLGCGTGDITIDLLDMFPKSSIVGVDPNGDMVSYTQKKYEKYKNVSWHQAAAENIGNTADFDVVVSFSALHWAQNITKALTNIRRALKDNAHFYAVLAAKKTHNTFDAAVDRQLGNAKYATRLSENMAKLDLVVHEYDAVEFTELLNKAGFNVHSCKAQEMPYIFASKQKFIDWMSASSPFKELLGDLHSSFVGDVATSYIELTGQENLLHVMYRDHLLYVTAQK